MDGASFAVGLVVGVGFVAAVWLLVILRGGR